MSGEFLTRKQEKSASIDELVLSHMPLVRKMARSFSRYGVDVDDLVQEGTIALMVAAKKFDAAKGTRFSTYATLWVRQYMREAVIRETSVVRPSSAAKARSKFFRERPYTYVSMETPITADEGIVLGDTFVSEDLSPEEQVIAAIDGQRLTTKLMSFLRKLRGRELEIIQSRYFAEHRETYDSIGKQFGLSNERIRQIESATIRKLRGWMETANV